MSAGESQVETIVKPLISSVTSLTRKSQNNKPSIGGGGLQVPSEILDGISHTLGLKNPPKKFGGLPAFPGLYITSSVLSQAGFDLLFQMQATDIL